MKDQWLVGCNFIPSTAINQLEMWQADTFDPATIARELSWAAALGMNTVRVYLHDLAWETDATGFKQRIDMFLTLAHRYRIRALFVIFDDCWNADPKPGRQPTPIPGVHNSGWLQSPGRAVVDDPSQWTRLKRYVTDLLTTFGRDERVLMWDLYNEPGQYDQESKRLPLVRAVFEWARAAKPSQPLTVGLWYSRKSSFKELNDFQLATSDVITFHNYQGADDLTAEITALKKHGRPLVCTEWMARGHSDVAACLPVFKREQVGCLNWGLVSGKTQTIWPWKSPAGAPEPAVWFHDLFRQDGTPFDPAEIQMFKNITNVNSPTR